MSMLEKILERQKKQREAIHLDAIPPADVTPAPSPSPAAPPTFTCPLCNSARAWTDRYGGGPHCFTCSPAPSRSLVAELIGDWPSESRQRLASANLSNAKSAQHLDAKSEAATPHLDAAAARSHTIATLDDSGAMESRQDAADAALARRIAFHEDLQRRWDRFCNRPPSAVIAIAEPA
jgi:hypothetical protein